MLGIVTRSGGDPVGILRPDVRASAYAFSLRVPIPGQADGFGLAPGGPIRAGDHIWFQTSPPTCRSSAEFVVR